MVAGGIIYLGAAVSITLVHMAVMWRFLSVPVSGRVGVSE